MEKVFLLWHTHDLGNGSEDDKLIGVYRTEADASDAIQRLKEKPGFCDCLSGFQINAYELNADHWQDGYETIEY